MAAGFPRTLRVLLIWAYENSTSMRRQLCR